MQWCMRWDAQVLVVVMGGWYLWEVLWEVLGNGEGFGRERGGVVILLKME